MIRAAGLASIVAGALLALAAAAPANESQVGEEPAPESAEEIQGSMKRGFEERRKMGTLFPWLKKRLQNQGPFLRDTSLDLHFRTYVFNHLPSFGPRESA